jgi:hypothetical protein
MQAKQVISILNNPRIWRDALLGYGVMNQPEKYGLTQEEFDEFIKEYNQYLDDQAKKETA